MSTRYAASSLMRLAVQEGQTPRFLQERSCCLAAREVIPDLAGTVHFELNVDVAGTVRAATATGGTIKDPAIISCLQTGLAAVWWETAAAWPTEYRLQLSLALRPAQNGHVAPLLARAASISEEERWLHSAIARGDGAAAMSAASALIEQAGDHEAQCQWRLARFEAAVLRAPWGDKYALEAGVALAGVRIDVSLRTGLTQCVETSLIPPSLTQREGLGVDAEEAAPQWTSGAAFWWLGSSNSSALRRQIEETEEEPLCSLAPKLRLGPFWIILSELLRRCGF